MKHCCGQNIGLVSCASPITATNTRHNLVLYVLLFKDRLHNTHCWFHNIELMVNNIITHALTTLIQYTIFFFFFCKAKSWAKEFQASLYHCVLGPFLTGKPQAIKKHLNANLKSDKHTKNKKQHLFTLGELKQRSRALPYLTLFYEEYILWGTQSFISLHMSSNDCKGSKSPIWGPTKKF